MLERRLREKTHRPRAAVVLCLWLAVASAGQAAGNDAAPVESNTGAELVLRALSLLGVNYKFGGNTPDTGLDCSGLVRHVYRETLGMVLPRRSDDMSRNGQSIDSAELRPGDLVFFNTMRKAFSHVGIYIGNGQFVHAPSTGGFVRVEQLSKQYWTQRFNGARRLLADSLGMSTAAGDGASRMLNEAVLRAVNEGAPRAANDGAPRAARAGALPMVATQPTSLVAPSTQGLPGLPAGTSRTGEPTLTPALPAQQYIN